MYASVVLTTLHCTLYAVFRMSADCIAGFSLHLTSFLSQTEQYAMWKTVTQSCVNCCWVRCVGRCLFLLGDVEWVLKAGSTGQKLKDQQQQQPLSGPLYVTTRLTLHQNSQKH